MDYLKLFQNHSEYEAFVSGGTMVKPNVSHCVSENEVHYNPIETRLIVKYLIVSVEENELQIYGYENYDSGNINNAEDVFDKVEVDGVEISLAELTNSEGKLDLSLGEHTIAYTLKDPTAVADSLFAFCSTVIAIIIPNSVVTIGEMAFYQTYQLSNVEIPNNVTTIGFEAFGDTFSLSSITIPNSVTSIGAFCFNGVNRTEDLIMLPTIPPTLSGDIFDRDSHTIPTIYVPAESINAYKTASGWSGYAEKIQAIPTT